MNSTPGVLGRRSFLRTASVVALATAGGGLLAACNSAVGDKQTGGGDNATPVRGGTLTIGTTSDVVPGNFFTNTSGAVLIIGLVYESLIRYPHDTVQPAPLLAKSWTLAPDGKSLTLELRDDVTFHSGRPFTAADAEFSLRTYADPKWSGQLKSTAAAISGYDSGNPHRLVLQFEHPLGNIFDLLDTVPIIDKESFDAFATGDKYVGTGPFQLTERTPNTRFVFDRNPHYWVPERPYLDRVEAQIVGDSQAQLNALKSGRILAADNLNYRDNENIGRTAGFKSVNYDGAELQLYVGANVGNPVLADVRLRQAVAYALDRDRVVSEVQRGAGYAINLPWPKTSPAFDQTRNTRYTRDLAKAKALVAQVGSVPKLPLTYSTVSPINQATAQIVQANLAEIGIETTLDPQENATFVKNLIGANFPALWVTDHSWAQFVPSTLTVSAYPFNARKNASHFDSPAYVAAADAAWQVTDGTGAQAVQAYQAVSDQLLENLFLIEISVRFQQVATAAKLHGLSWTKRRETLYTEAFLA
ncbi:ABC transporter substrate-binding protein [Nocardia sp. alder85J]|uniref:ABC transporter substrate-binding protein n=1 Tax=Nocardia sp. alder85J TaxID=2862949 RepID=UPI001CD443D8|nr:ABC transporter substrate-binding protein [Nocardia sp. alder85J]MCX4092270.1 ABC transporter substrate-binding protein [Nocardia sp. alder85J]